MEDMVITTWSSELAEGASVELQAEESEVQTEAETTGAETVSSEQ